LCLCGDEIKSGKSGKLFFLWAFGKHPQKSYKITESTKFGIVISEVYCNQWAVGTVGVLVVSRTEGACCHTAALDYTV